jgi:hypothetical protein
VRLLTRTLDRQIVDGASLDDPLRALRARQLASRIERRRVAAWLAAIIDAADEREADPTSRLILDHAAVIATRTELLALIELLRSDTDVSPRGMALTRRLAQDPDGPLIRRRPDRPLHEAVAEVVDALEERPHQRRAVSRSQLR